MSGLFTYVNGCDWIKWLYGYWTAPSCLLYYGYRTALGKFTCSIPCSFILKRLCAFFLQLSKCHCLNPTPTQNMIYTWSDNKVRKLTTVCLPLQHWTKALVWFDDDISAFHSCVVVLVLVLDLWHSLSEWHLLLPVCVLVCRHEKVGAWIRATNEH